MLLSIDLVAKRLAFDVRHHVEQNARRLARVVNRNDVRMSKTCDCLDFLEKSFSAERGGDVGIEHFDGYTPIVPRVASAIDGRHATSAELILYGIAVA